MMCNEVCTCLCIYGNVAESRTLNVLVAVTVTVTIKESFSLSLLLSINVNEPRSPLNATDCFDH